MPSGPKPNVEKIHPFTVSWGGLYDNPSERAKIVARFGKPYHPGIVALADEFWRHRNMSENDWETLYSNLQPPENDLYAKATGSEAIHPAPESSANEFAKRCHGELIRKMNKAVVAAMKCGDISFFRQLADIMEALEEEDPQKRYETEETQILRAFNLCRSASEIVYEGEKSSLKRIYSEGATPTDEEIFAVLSQLFENWRERRSPEADLKKINRFVWNLFRVRVRELIRSMVDPHFRRIWRDFGEDMPGVQWPPFYSVKDLDREHVLEALSAEGWIARMKLPRQKTKATKIVEEELEKLRAEAQASPSG